MIHEPVLLHEVLETLAPVAGAIVVDATVNRGGHSRALCQTLGSAGTLIGLDADGEALKEAKDNLSSCPSQVELINTNFHQMREAIPESYHGRIDAILMDLGLSSNQLESSGRGFSFQRDEPLLMTFASAPEADAETASTIVNNWSEAEIAGILKEYGEEGFDKQIAKGLVVARQAGPITTTGELVAAIKAAVPEWYTHKRLHFATRTFQALRIATNDELTVLAETIPTAWELLKVGGRIGIISFHSLEARLVKNVFREYVKLGRGELVIKHAAKPSYEEVKKNPRARSAQLRVIKKLS